MIMMTEKWGQVNFSLVEVNVIVIQADTFLIAT